MAYFRLITAEEEAAAAVFHALRRWRYEHAHRLNPKNHVHKLALRPFVAAVQYSLELTGAQFVTEIVDGPRGEHIRVVILHKDGRETAVDPPLDIAVYREVIDVENERQMRLLDTMERDNPKIPPELLGQPHNFEEGIERLARLLGDSLLTYVREMVTLRRNLLYAGTEGYWDWESDKIDEDTLDHYADKVMSHVLLYLMIDQFPKQQLLVTQCLPVFLRELELLPNEQQIIEQSEDTVQPPSDA